MELDFYCAELSRYYDLWINCPDLEVKPLLWKIVTYYQFQVNRLIEEEERRDH